MQTINIAKRKSYCSYILWNSAVSCGDSYARTNRPVKEQIGPTGWWELIYQLPTHANRTWLVFAHDSDRSIVVDMYTTIPLVDIAFDRVRRSDPGNRVRSGSWWLRRLQPVLTETNAWYGDWLGYWRPVWPTIILITNDENAYLHRAIIRRVRLRTDCRSYIPIVSRKTASSYKATVSLSLSVNKNSVKRKHFTVEWKKIYLTVKKNVNSNASDKVLWWHVNS